MQSETARNTIGSPVGASGRNAATASDQREGEVMTDVHKETINTCYKDLVDNVVVDDVVNHLRSSHILTLRNAEDLRQSGGISKKAEVLLDILLRKPDLAFNKLVEALRSTRQGHLADLLVREERSHSLDHCEQHLRQKITLFCKTCSQPACIECKKEKHQSHDMELLSVMTKKFEQDMRDVAKHCEKRLASLQQISSDLDETGAQLDIDVDKIDQQISETANNMCSLIRHYEDKLKNKLHGVAKTAQKHISKAKADLLDTFTAQTSSLRSDAEATAIPSDALVTRGHTVLQAVTIMKRFMRQQDLPVPFAQCSINTSLVELTETTGTTNILGNVDINTSTCTWPDSRKNFKTENVSLGAPLQTIKLDYTGRMPVNGIAPIHKTMICVTHSSQEYIWVYTTEGQPKQKIQIPGIAKIYCMVSIDGNEGKLAIVADTSDVQFVTLSEDLEVLSLQHTTKDVPGNPDRISIGCNKQLIVNYASGNKLIVLSAASEVLSTVEAAIPLDKEVNVSATQTNSGFVICDEENKKVYFTDVNGHIVHTSTDCVHPWRAVHTSWRHVLIADGAGHEVKVFSEAGEFLGNVHDNNGSITYPQYMHVDETERLLYITRGGVGEQELRTYKFAPSDLPPLPVQRTITNLEVTIKLAKA